MPTAELREIVLGTHNLRAIKIAPQLSLELNVAVPFPVAPIVLFIAKAAPTEASLPSSTPNI